MTQERPNLLRTYRNVRAPASDAVPVPKHGRLRAARLAWSHWRWARKHWRPD